jgi:hypothetical protein
MHPKRLIFHPSTLSQRRSFFTHKRARMRACSLYRHTHMPACSLYRHAHMRACSLHRRACECIYPSYNHALLRTNTRSQDIINTITEYTIDPQSNIEETTQYYYQTLEVGQHHPMDHIMEGILSCSLASSRGHPPIELPLQIQYFSSCLITLLEPLYIVLPSPKNILEEKSSRSRTF